MLLIDCPYCGSRPELEFRYGGEAHLVREAEATDDAWARFLYLRRNPLGVHAERWRHVHGCAQYFNALRNTKSDRMLATYKIGEPAPELS